MPHALCFVLMPFGTKAGPDGQTIHFDQVYETLIAPAIRAANLEPLRADQEVSSGIIHKPMFERLILCRFAVADLTHANPNVYYELGVRHAAKPRSTVQVIAEGARLPFDVQMMRTIPYRVTAAGDPAVPQPAAAAITNFLIEAQKEPQTIADSPIYQLINAAPMSVAHEKTDIFERQFAEAAERKGQFRKANDLDELRAMDRALGDLADDEAGSLVALMLAYRDLKGFEEMVSLIRRMPPHLRETIMVREQLGLALNRLGRRQEAIQALEGLIQERGPSSETYGILGRVYKDLWDASRKTNSPDAGGYLKRAIETYRKGFEADWRDAYPGINLLTLLTIKNPNDPQIAALVPVVRYSVERKIARGPADYWDYATLVELAVLGRNEDAARDALGDALAQQSSIWMKETTANNLRIIRDARGAAAEPWLLEIEQALRDPK